MHWACSIYFILARAWQWIYSPSMCWFPKSKPVCGFTYNRIVRLSCLPPTFEKHKNQCLFTKELVSTRNSLICRHFLMVPLSKWRDVVGVEAKIQASTTKHCWHSIVNATPTIWIIWESACIPLKVGRDMDSQLMGQTMHNSPKEASLPWCKSQGTTGLIFSFHPWDHCIKAIVILVFIKFLQMWKNWFSRWQRLGQFWMRRECFCAMKHCVEQGCSKNNN